MVARQTGPGCTRCVRTEKGSARTKRARAEAPRTEVYVIRTWISVGRGEEDATGRRAVFLLMCRYRDHCLNCLSLEVVPVPLSS